MLLPGHSAGNTDFWTRYVGGTPLHWDNSVGVSPPGRTKDYREATMLIR